MTEPTISTFSVTKGAKAEETYACLAAWDLSRPVSENLERLRDENPILAPTDAWLQEMVRILRLRFANVELHRPLIRLAQRGLPLETWRPILLWHLCQRELLLSDFLDTWLFPRREEGLLRVRPDDVRTYLAQLHERGLLDAAWRKSSIDRMASGLPAYAADLGLLQGKAVKEIPTPFVADEALLYVLHWMRDEGLGSQRSIEDRRWRWYLLSRSELEAELLRLHQRGALRFESAGTVISLDLPYPSLEAYVDALV